MLTLQTIRRGFHGLCGAAVFAATLLALGGCGLVSSGAVPYSPYVTEIDFSDLLATAGKEKLPLFIEQYDPANCDQDCKAQHQVVNNLAQTYQGKVKFYRVRSNGEEFTVGAGIGSPVYFMVEAPFTVYDTDSGVKTEAQLTKFIDDAYKEITAPPDAPPDPSSGPPVTPPANLPGLHPGRGH